MSKTLPIYQINQFESKQPDNDFYVNKINLHAKLHQFAELPHKHDFFLMLFITNGHGKHQVDFQDHEIKAGRFFFIRPGQMHYWMLSENIEGFVFFHSIGFYNNHLNHHKISDFHHFKNYQNEPFVDLKAGTFSFVSSLLSQLYSEYNNNQPMRISKAHSMIHLIYIEISRNYKSSAMKANRTYLEKLNKFEILVESHYLTKKMPREYAALLNMTEKHLNRIIKHCLNKTTTELIADRLIIEAKRMLLHSDLQVNQVSDKLGFSERSYFNRFFKKQTLLTPNQFRNQYTNM